MLVLPNAIEIDLVPHVFACGVGEFVSFARVRGDLSLYLCH